VSTRALLDALRDDRRRDWACYGVATVFGVMALLNTVFVIAAQLLIAVLVLSSWPSHLPRVVCVFTVKV